MYMESIKVPTSAIIKFRLSEAAKKFRKATAKKVTIASIKA